MLYYFFLVATLTIITQPADALVKLDGKAIARTPVEGMEISAGLHKLEISHSYYAPYSEAIDVRSGDRLLRKLDLQLGMGRIKLLSNPKGAWVELDGRRLEQVTPIEIEVKSGPHEITMGQLERRPASQSIELKAEETLSVNLSLNIDPHGTVEFKVKPVGAKIEFIAEQISYRAGMRIPIGEYSLRVSKRGYVTQEFRYKVRYGENQRQINLHRQFARLTVDVREKDSFVDVSYQIGRDRATKRYKKNMLIPTGRINVRAGAIGYKTVQRSIDLGPSGASLKFVLAKLEVDVSTQFADAFNYDGKPRKKYGPEMVVLPAGKFLMGNDDGPLSEKPAHVVVLGQPFAVSRYEVTVAQFLQFVVATKRDINEKIYRLDPQTPAAYLSHKDAVDYTRWLSKVTGERYRLMTEAEWEYAARAGSQTKYFFGDDPLEICNYANIRDQAARKVFRSWLVTQCDDGQVRPVIGGLYDANEFGLYDMYGNVSEWVLECGIPSYSKMDRLGIDMLTGESCESHGYRGGAWDSAAEEAISSYRNASSTVSDDRGIRLLREF
jgi:formylglycine-generating enzyme required for sulfatase activity